MMCNNCFQIGKGSTCRLVLYSYLVAIGFKYNGYDTDGRTH